MRRRLKPPALDQGLDRHGRRAKAGSRSCRLAPGPLSRIAGRLPRTMRAMGGASCGRGRGYSRGSFGYGSSVRLFSGRSGVSTTRRISPGEYTAPLRPIPSRVTRSQAAEPQAGTDRGPGMRLLSRLNVRFGPDYVRLYEALSVKVVLVCVA